MARPRTNFEERFWSKVDKTDPSGCWIWKGTVRRRTKDGGYGCISLPGAPCRYAAAHRIAYELAKGSILEGCQLHHLCNNRLCVNPNHLETTTAVEHPRANSDKTHCPRGHRYDYFRNGKRYCMRCIIERNRIYRQRRRRMRNASTGALCAKVG
jgi:HNH endonuclease